MTISDNINARPGHFFEPPAPTASQVVTGVSRDAVPDRNSDVELSVYANFADVAAIWRSFEKAADCMAFQSFAWHDAWQRSVGVIVGSPGTELEFAL